MLRRFLPTVAAASAAATTRTTAPRAAAVAAASHLQHHQHHQHHQQQQQRGAPALLQIQRRLLSGGAGDAQSAESAEREERMRALLKEKLQPTHLVIQDISGGCGAMYNMEVESPLFKGKTLVAQHRMVNEVLAKEIAEMHGLSLKTRPSKA